MKTNTNRYHGYRFPPEVISHGSPRHRSAEETGCCPHAKPFQPSLCVRNRLQRAERSLDLVQCQAIPSLRFAAFHGVLRDVGITSWH
jgi:hypothetical protein